MMAARHPFIALTAAALLMFAFGTAQGATISVFSGDANLAGWTAAAGAPVIIEDFNDPTLVPGLSITFGNSLPGSISGGVYHDRANDDLEEQTTKPKFTFSPAIKAFGAHWNLAGPGGPGTGIKLHLTFADSTVMDVATQIPNTFTGQFFGIVSDTKIVSIRFDEGTTPDNFETFDMENARFVPAQVITTVAGTGVAGFLGDGAAATSARLNFPRGVAVGASFYIADRHNHRVRRVDTAAVPPSITTVAGTGVAGFSGDGVAATSAQLNLPSGVAVDGLGNLYVADFNNHRIRKIVPGADGVVNGGLGETITTVAGNGVFGSAGDGGPATAASLWNPKGVAVFGMNLYIADEINAKIRRVNLTAVPPSISTVAGTGVAGFSGDGVAATLAKLNGPIGVAVDGAGNVYIADEDNDRVRKVVPGADTVVNGGLDETISTVAGTGVAGFSGDGAAATLAQLNAPSGVAVDGAGNLYIADLANHRIRWVSAFDGRISTLAGTGTAGFSGEGGAPTAANLSSPAGVAVDGAGNAYIADLDNHRIRKVGP